MAVEGRGEGEQDALPSILRRMFERTDVRCYSPKLPRLLPLPFLHSSFFLLHSPAGWGEGLLRVVNPAVLAVSPGATLSSLRSVALVLLMVVVACLQSVGAPKALQPVVEAEENIYTYTNADNGAGPLWCHGSTCLVRIGNDLFASGLRRIHDRRQRHLPRG